MDRDDIQRLSIRDVSLRWRQALEEGREPPYETIGDFLDDFRHRASGAQRCAMIEKEPVWMDSVRGAECNAYWAAMVETLCRECDLRPPAWTESPRCFLRRPWFAGGMESLKATLLVESPAAFRRRNLFVSANALSRA
jgi:hypothetical protein